MIKNILIILLLGIVLVTGCTQVPPNENGFQEKELSFETVDKDVNSNLEEKNNYVIQNKEEFQILWDKIGSLKLLDEIDFSKYTVIAVFQGQKNSGGYSIEITKIVEKKGVIIISIKELEAGPGQAAAVITSPYHIIKTNKLTKNVEFEIESNKPPLPPNDLERSWIDELIDKELKGQVNPLDRDYGYLSKCQYKSETHYLLVRPCCDQFNELFDESGNSICLPSGGETGKGSGDCPDFVKQISNCEVIWKPTISNENPKNIELNKEFTLEVGEGAILKEDDLRIKFLEVVEDSRCPLNVQCIRAGDVKVKVDARYDEEKNLGQYILTLGRLPEDAIEPFSMQGYVLEILKVEPMPVEGQEIMGKDYKVTFKVYRTATT